jgi:uncharacterized membrane protein
MHTIQPSPALNGNQRWGSRIRETVLRQLSKRDQRTRPHDYYPVQKATAPRMLAEAERRSAQVQLRVADAITSFAGSMNFVYLHAVV